MRKLWDKEVKQVNEGHTLVNGKAKTTLVCLYSERT